MATYSKTTWATGDLITAEKMNKVETQLETITPGATGSVRFDTSLSLTDAQKTQARTNMDVLSPTETNNRLAAAYNSATSYAVGDYCMYNNKLYRCITAATNIVPTNTTYWVDENTVAGALKSLKTNVNDSIAPAYSSATNYAIDDYCMYNNKLYRCIAAATNILPTNTTYWVEENTVSGALKSLDAVKADIGGYYTGLTVGNAEQLVSTVGIEDKVPYNFRTAGGAGGANDIGDRENVKSVVGASYPWNQMVQNGNFSNGITEWHPTTTTSYSVSNNVLTFTATVQYGGVQSPAISFVRGHKYLAKTDASFASTDGKFYVYLSIDGTLISNTTKKTTSWNSYCSIIDYQGDSDERQIVFQDNRSENWDAWNITNVCVFDLTLLFGSTIADYIYSLEQATTGAGVAFFRSLFPAPYYAYNAGELMHVQTSAHKMTGFNQWDEVYGTNITIGSYSGNFGSVNYIHVIPGATYHFTTGDYRPGASGIRLAFYDADKNLISSTVHYSANLTIPDNCHYIKFGVQLALYGSTYKNDICINLHWDGERDGEYEPYEEHSYPLDSDLVLRGIPKLDANNNLYYDGDTYASDGTVTRRYGIVDLGTLDWIYDSTYTVFMSYGEDAPANIKFILDNNSTIICSKYAISPIQSALSADKTIYLRNDATKRLGIKDSSYTDAATFKAAMSGVYLVYELATSTEETADPYVNPQIVNDFGTEEFIDAAVEAGDRDVSIPVGHESQYMANLRDKLQHLPDLASSNGTYVITQANSQMTLTPLTTPTELPAAPTTDGTYKLRCVVSSGTATYSWVADS